MQFIALFGELKKGEWPTFGAQHDYWEKAANFIQETARTNFKRSSKCSALHFLYSVKYICMLKIETSYVVWYGSKKLFDFFLIYYSVEQVVVHSIFIQQKCKKVLSIFLFSLMQESF